MTKSLDERASVYALEKLAIYGRNDTLHVSTIDDYTQDAFKAGWNECHVEDMKTIWALEEKLRIACEGLEFYANKSNWVSRTGKIGVSPIDTTDREFNSEYSFAGGRLARSTLSKIKGVE